MLLFPVGKLSANMPSGEATNPYGELCVTIPQDSRLFSPADNRTQTFCIYVGPTYGFVLHGTPCIERYILGDVFISAQSFSIHGMTITKCLYQFSSKMCVPDY